MEWEICTMSKMQLTTLAMIGCLPGAIGCPMSNPGGSGGGASVLSPGIYSGRVTETTYVDGQVVETQSYSHTLTIGPHGLPEGDGREVHVG